jgi:hypothetical protein
MALRNDGILAHHHTASQPTRPRLEFCVLKVSKCYKRCSVALGQVLPCHSSSTITLIIRDWHNMPISGRSTKGLSLTPLQILYANHTADLTCMCVRKKVQLSKFIFLTPFDISY